MRSLRDRVLAAVSVVLGLAVIAAACTSGKAGTDGTPSPATPISISVDPTARPTGPSADTFQTRWPIKHVVFLIKENRSFDNLFGRFPGANGATTGMDHGVERPLTRGEDQRAHDLTHCYNCALAAVNDGQMDGFNQSDPDNQYAYTQFRPEQLPNYWHWAQNNVLADNFFASAMGPSFPNHLYSIAAQSGGALDNPWQPFNTLNDMLQSGLAKSWGCDIAKGGYVEIIDPEGQLVKVDPCFDFKTEGDLLNEAGIPWGYYAATNTQQGYIWSAYAAMDRYRNDPELWNEHIFPVDNVLQDIKANNLPPVTWITPRFQLSEHPEYNFCHGENWSTKVIDAIMNSDMWKDTAIFVTWDDYGGFYDHVPPKQIDPFGYGIRVPFMVISPYAKQGFIDHKEGEFSSVLRFIEDNWGLTQLTKRDRRAGNLSYDFDFSGDPRPPDPLPLRTDCEGPIWSPPPPDEPQG